MNTASLELCRELYELSGWDNPDELNSYGLRIDNDVNPFECPAYDLGYLLRKLEQAGNPILLKNNAYSDNKRWSCTIINQAAVLADTPEDAACKLAIELFKQGILT